MGESVRVLALCESHGSARRRPPWRDGERPHRSCTFRATRLTALPRSNLTEQMVEALARATWATWARRDLGALARGPPPPVGAETDNDRRMACTLDSGSGPGIPAESPFGMNRIFFGGPAEILEGHPHHGSGKLWELWELWEGEERESPLRLAPFGRPWSNLRHTPAL